MARLWADSQTIQVELDETGWPKRFVWQGERHAVQRIQQRWQVDGDWWSAEGRVWREYIALITAGGLLCVIYFDLQDQTWHLSRMYD